MIQQRCLKLWLEIENSLDYAGGRGNKRNNKQDKLLKFFIKVLPDFIHKL